VQDHCIKQAAFAKQKSITDVSLFSEMWGQGDMVCLLVLSSVICMYIQYLYVVGTGVVDVNKDCKYVQKQFL